MSRSRVLLPDKILQEKDFNPFEFWNEADSKLEELASDITQEVNHQVKLHFEGFNASTAKFSNIISGITVNQKATSTMQENMTDSKNLLLSRNQNLKNLWLEHETLTRALDILEKIEYVRQVPSQLQMFGNARQYLHSVILLQHTVEMVCGDDLSEIAGLKELRDNLLMSRNTVQETLLEELLALVYVPVQTDEETVKKLDEASSIDLPSITRSKCTTSRFSPFFENEDELLKYEATDQYLRNPTGEEKLAMRLIVEALDRMHHLPSAKTQLTKTIREKLKSIVESETKNFRKELAFEESRRLFAVNSTQANPFSDSNETNSNAAITKRILGKFVAQIFGRFLNILRHHIHVTSLIHTKMQLHDPDGFGGNSQRETYTIENVWRDMQVVVKAMLSDFLEPGEQELLLAKNAIKQMNENNEYGLSFSFDASRQASLAKAMSNKQKSLNQEHENNNNGNSGKKDNSSFEKNPYNMTIVYRPVVQFIERALSIIGKNREEKEEIEKDSLKEYLSTFITTTLLRHVTADINIRLDQIIQDSASFAPKEDEERKLAQSNSNTGSGNNSNSAKPVIVMKSAIEIAHVVQKVVGYVFLLPTAAQQLLDILSYVVEKFLSKCQQKYVEVTRDAYSAKCLSDVNLYNTITSDPSYVEYRNTPPPKNLLKLYSCDNPLYARLYTDLHLSRGDLIWDFSSWNLLTLLTETLDWLANKNFTSFPDREENDRDKLPSGTKSLSNAVVVFKSTSFLSPRQTQSHARQRRSSLTLSGTPTDITMLVASQLSQIQQQCKRVGEKALLTLRFEMHCHFFYFLSEIQNNSYYSVNEATQPDTCVLELNRDLSTIDDMITKFCSWGKVNFLWSGSSQLLTSIVIDSLATMKDKRLSDKGVSKLRRNLFAIQQGLAQVTSVDPDIFDHARWFVGLLELSDEDLEKTLEDERNDMSERHINALVEVITTKRPRGESRLRASRRLLKDAPPVRKLGSNSMSGGTNLRPK